MIIESVGLIVIHTIWVAFFASVIAHNGFSIVFFLLVVLNLAGIALNVFNLTR
jgi:hypothetical protein